MEEGRAQEKGAEVGLEVAARAAALGVAAAEAAACWEAGERGLAAWAAAAWVEVGKARVVQGRGVAAARGQATRGAQAALVALVA